MTNPLKGLVYIKQGRIGSKSEGPDYFLQTKKGEYELRLSERNPWEPDYKLEFYCRRMIEVKGEISEGAKPPMIKVASITEILPGMLP